MMNSRRPLITSQLIINQRYNITCTIKCEHKSCYTMIFNDKLHITHTYKSICYSGTYIVLNMLKLYCLSNIHRRVALFI